VTKITLLAGSIFFSFVLCAQDTISDVVLKIEQINSQREAMASTLGPPSGPGKLDLVIDENTFKQVCQPVGMSLMEWAKAGANSPSKLDARQVTDRYRNEKHKPNKQEKKILRDMHFDKDLVWKIVKESKNGEDGFRLYRRIDIQPSCLHCHGSKNSRPQFIVEKYPNDKAFGYPRGSLRGAYSVWIKAK
jgi:hypothetical protein